MKNNKKKITLIIISIVLSILLIGEATYAWYRWRSSSPVSVRLSINDSEVTLDYNGGSNVTGELIPTLTKEEGISKTVTAYSNINAVYIDFWLKINTLPNALKDSTFKWQLYNSNTLIGSGNFSTESINSSTSNGDTDYLLANTINISNDSNNPSSFTLYLWVDGTVDNNYQMAGNNINFDLYATGSILSRKPAADFITQLYNSASKSTATVNSITYNLASSVGLMKDRYGSSTNGQDTGNIRYYGANPNNYVWLGDTYTSSYSFTSNGQNITRESGDKKLWRIIGVFDGRLKLILNDPISTQGLSWDSSANATGGNNGYGINQWGPSGTYEGADLMRLLNPGYESETVNNSLYWNKETGNVYRGSNNSVSSSEVSFANTGLSSSEKNMIDTAVWHTGAYDNFSYANVHYQNEMGGVGKTCTQNNTYCSDTVERTNSWTGKVGLMSASDYGYATDLTTCNQILNGYNNTACKNNDWLLDSSALQWTISPRAYSSNANSVFHVHSTGDLNFDYANDTGRVRPAVYLKSGVTISGGNGSQSDPYVLNLG